VRPLKDGKSSGVASFIVPDAQSEGRALITSPNFGRSPTVTGGKKPDWYKDFLIAYGQ